MNLLNGEKMKLLLSEAGQCIIIGIILLLIIFGFKEILDVMTGG